MHDTATARPVATAAAGTAAPAFSLLFVDDEPNILSALRRLFRPAGYRIHVANSGAEGLAVLEREPIDLVVSDMRMPEMTGAQLLAEVRRRWPDTMRILLTGYADITSTIAAINEGQLHRYIPKPWNDQDILLIVREACERRALELERARLEALTLSQNEELKALNASLEAKVAERTAALATAHDKLKAGFLNTLKVFSGLIELRGGTMAGHSRRVADYARRIAQAMNLPQAEAQDVFFAALLHDIGKIAVPDALLNKPVNSLTTDERSEVLRHPQKGESVLMGLEQLRGAAQLIRSHHERYDGQGYPDQIAGAAIPPGARILAVANDYDGLLQGSLFGKRASLEDAANFLRAGRGKRYDPDVVDAFLGLLGTPAPVDKSGFKELSGQELEPGMALARDLVTREGVLLLARDFILDASLIKQITDFEETEGYSLRVAVVVR